MSTARPTPNAVTPVSIRTTRLHIRELEPSDWPGVHRYAADPRVVEYLWWGPNSEADTRTFIEKVKSERTRISRLDFDLAVTLRRCEVESERETEAHAETQIDVEGGNASHPLEEDSRSPAPGAVIGGCSLHARGKPEYRTAEIGYCFVPETWRQGYATETVAALLDFAFATAGLHRVFALVDPENGASIRLLERLGLRREGRMRKDTLIRGRWRDSLIYAMLAEEWAGRVAWPKR
jgi:RimJ/RimL family protein N-acetyltransferase